MRKPRDIRGERYGQLIAVEYHHAEPPHHYWIFRCDCGNTKITRYNAVSTGNTRSCGCIGNGRVTHGDSNTPVYKVWQAMLDRCLNDRNPFYPDYGGRGINVCARWQYFGSFRDDMGPRPDKGSIERRDVNGHYEPTNCIWASKRAQSNNRRNNRNVSYRGETHTVSEWARLTGLTKSCILYRVTHGWPTHKALTTPSNRGKNSGEARRHIPSLK